MSFVGKILMQILLSACSHQIASLKEIVCLKLYCHCHIHILYILRLFMPLLLIGQYRLNGKVQDAKRGAGPARTSIWDWGVAGGTVCRSTHRYK